MTAPLPRSNQATRAKLTARDFWTLADAGAFEGFAKTELIEGEIWVVNWIYSWHAKTVARMTIELGIACRSTHSDLVVYTSGSIDLSDDSVPETDISVGENNDHRGLPGSKLRLAVEVSDSALAQDMGRKARLYATNGVPEYWVVDREGQRVVQMWQPTDGAYAERREIAFGGSITVATIPDWTIDTSGM